MKKIIIAVIFFVYSFISLQAAQPAEHREISNWHLIPAMPRVYWCAPTSKAMIFSFWDNTYPEMGYGRLVGFWYTHPKYNVNIPDFVDTMIDRNTGTWYKGLNFINSVNRRYGYRFQSIEVESNASNDWNWELLKREINANRPVLWGFNVNGNEKIRHVVVGIGYRELPGRKIVIVLDSNGPNNIYQRRKEYDHYLGYRLECYIPGGGTYGSNLRLLTPLGGERIYTNRYNRIVWYIWGNMIKTVDITCSIDGGLSWFIVANKVAAHEGQNEFTWVPNFYSQRARIAVAGFAYNGYYIAGDGSRGFFPISSN
jgi:hypothetical protein